MYRSGYLGELLPTPSDILQISTSSYIIFFDASHVKENDKIILTGWLGDHSIHLLSMREGLGYEQRVLSDCAPLNGMIDKLLTRLGGSIHAMRDVTRGGLSAVAHEFAEISGCDIQIHSHKLPIRPEVVMATDMLGISALNLANEGCLCMFIDPDYAEEAIQILKSDRYGKAACEIGEVIKGHGRVLLRKDDGTVEILEELVGAEIPRLC